jgi:hypothetical protein
VTGFLTHGSVFSRWTKRLEVFMKQWAPNWPSVPSMVFLSPGGLKTQERRIVLAGFREQKERPAHPLAFALFLGEWTE